ncbi:hypothetical protein ACFO3O_09185 [Dokdonia ponticola]|uniref:Uncharacterized protein n=1 Tax=Dokdonia ponticola TaxID=2041041 RepID=A0ABV9HV95_9FLAO
MDINYYNSKEGVVTKEIFDKEKQHIIAIEDLDYHANELEKLWSK